MRLKLEHTEERLTRRSGLVLIDRFGKKIRLGEQVDTLFPAPGSNRGFAASTFVSALMEMMIDGGMHLDDIRLFEEDRAYKEMTGRTQYPTSDAIGDWLRRHGEAGAEVIGEISDELVRKMTFENDLVLDIDTTIIVSEKGDAERSYKGMRGYNPLLGACPKIGLFLTPRFQQGNISPQTDLVSYLIACQKALPNRITTIRIDSAGYNHFVINHCMENHLLFTITGDHDSAVMEKINTLPAASWKQGFKEDGIAAKYQIAETIHTMNQTREAFRLVIKRTERRSQLDLFEDYSYWIIATNIPQTKMDAQKIIDHHEDRGRMEKMIGELKTHLHLDHLPCGQFSANSLYFSVGVLAYNTVVLLKRQYFGIAWQRKTIESLRYYLLNVPAHLVKHSRYLIARMALRYDLFEILNDVYNRIIARPLAPV